MCIRDRSLGASSIKVGRFSGGGSIDSGLFDKGAVGDGNVSNSAFDGDAVAKDRHLSTRRERLSDGIRFVANGTNSHAHSKWME